MKDSFSITPALRTKLIELADKYESQFALEDDPCQFMHRDYSIADKEVVALIASSLAFGRRDQIISHITIILEHIASSDSELTHKSPSEWIRTGTYKKLFHNSKKSFYRIFSQRDMLHFCDTLRVILLSNVTLGSYYKREYEKKCGVVPLYKIICQSFADKQKGCGTLIPQTETSACKRVQLFLRWMVRGVNCKNFSYETCTNLDGTPKCLLCKKNKDPNKLSPVDLALWTWYDKRNLLVPLDTHVIQEAVKFGLLPKTASGKMPGATIQMAQLLTDEMKTVWPDDPAKADFALFGLGIDGIKTQQLPTVNYR